MLQRKAYRNLLKWKESKNRKPLIIRGARQVGKSTLINQFSQEFDYSISLNLERPRDKQVFDELLEVKDVVNRLFLENSIILNGKTVLLFIDEIQESTAAIAMLRFFYEDYPQLFVIAAGSLLEFAIQNVGSFPVGRVEQFVLHPLDFEEFLMATQSDSLLKAYSEIPVKPFAHTLLLEKFHQYTMLGGMPEVVNTYVEEQDFVALQPIYQNLWQSYMDDVEKYGTNVSEVRVIRHIMQTAPSENDRITFAGFGNSNYRSREMGEAFRALDLAKIIRLVYPCTNFEIPLIVDYKRKPRLQFLDTGLLNAALGIQANFIGVEDLYNLYKGRIVPHIFTQEYIAQQNQPLYKPVFWVRENSNSNAEVDFIIVHKNQVIPVEIKSGSSGRLRSLHEYIDRSESLSSGQNFAVRVLGNQLSIEQTTTPKGTPYTLLNLPYYLSAKIGEYIEWGMG